MSATYIANDSAECAEIIRRYNEFVEQNNLREAGLDENGKHLFDLPSCHDDWSSLVTVTNFSHVLKVSFYFKDEHETIKQELRRKSLITGKPVVLSKTPLYTIMTKPKFKCFHDGLSYCRNLIPMNMVNRIKVEAV